MSHRRGDDTNRVNTNLRSISDSIGLLAAIAVFVQSTHLINLYLYTDPEARYSNTDWILTALPFAIYYLVILFLRTQMKVGRLSVSIVVTSASLLGLVVSGFIAYAAYSTDKGLVSQGCLYALSAILFCEVLYLRRIVTADIEVTGGTSVVA
jgi:hypothetical protein